MRRKIKAQIAVGGLALILSAASVATPIRVSQESAAGAGDFDANVLGAINVFDSVLTAAQYYAYNTNFGASFDDGGQDVTLTSNMSHIFFVDGLDGLSMFFVHDKPNDAGGGSADMTVTIVGDTASVLVSDDPWEGIISNGPNTIEVNQTWFSCCTDGFAIGLLDNGWSTFAEFDNLVWGDFAGWKALDGNSEIALSADFNRRVRFDMVAVAEPGMLALFGLGIFGIGFVARKKLLDVHDSRASRAA